MDMHEIYLNDVSVQDNAEFENKHPRKGGKFCKKGAGGGVQSKLDELKEDIAYGKKWVEEAKAGKVGNGKMSAAYIKKNEKYVKGLELQAEFLEKNPDKGDFASYSKKMQFIIDNLSALGATGVASVKKDAWIGKAGNFIIYPVNDATVRSNMDAMLDRFGLGYKMTENGNFQVYMKDAPKQKDGAVVNGFEVSTDSLKEKVKTMPKLSDGVEVSVEGRGGKASVTVTFKGQLSEEDTKKISDHLGVDLMQKEYDNNGWVVFDAYAKDSVPSFMMLDQYHSRDEVALAVADRPALAKVAPMTPEESVAYYQSVGRNARIGEKNGKKGIFTSLDLGDGKTSQEEFCSTKYATDFMHNHILRNKKYGFPVKFSVPKRWTDAIANTSLYKKYSGESK